MTFLQPRSFIIVFLAATDVVVLQRSDRQADRLVKVDRKIVTQSMKEG